MGEVIVLHALHHGLDMPRKERVSCPSSLGTFLLMNQDYERRVGQSIVPFPDRQFLIKRSLEGNMVEIEGFMMKVICHVFLFLFFFCL